MTFLETGSTSVTTGHVPWSCLTFTVYSRMQTRCKSD